MYVSYVCMLRMVAEPCSTGVPLGTFSASAQKISTLFQSILLFSFSYSHETATPPVVRTKHSSLRHNLKYKNQGRYSITIWQIMGSEEQNNNDPSLQDQAAETANKVKDAAGEKAEELQGKAAGLKDDATEKTANFTDSILNTAGGVKDTLFSTAGGLKDNVAKTAGEVKDTVLNTAGGVANKAGELLQKGGSAIQQKPEDSKPNDDNQEK